MLHNFYDIQLCHMFSRVFIDKPFLQRQTIIPLLATFTYSELQKHTWQVMWKNLIQININSKNRQPTHENNCFKQKLEIWVNSVPCLLQRLTNLQHNNQVGAHPCCWVPNIATPIQCSSQRVFGNKCWAMR